MADDFPIPYLTWSELEDTIYNRAWLEIGHSTSPTSDQSSIVSDLASCFSHDERFGGRLKPFIEYLGGLVDNGEHVTVVSRQSPRLGELWGESREPTGENNPAFVEASLSEGFIIQDGTTSTHLITDSEVFGWERPQPRMRQRQVAEAPLRRVVVAVRGRGAYVRLLAGRSHSAVVVARRHRCAARGGRPGAAER